MAESDGAQSHTNAPRVKRKRPRSHASGRSTTAGPARHAPTDSPFWDRPFIHLSRSPVPALLETLGPDVRALPVGVGSIEQQTDNVDVLLDPWHRRSLAESVLTLAASPGQTS